MIFVANFSHRVSAGWVQCQLGRAWYEMVDYVQAKAAFEKARKRDPQRLEVNSQSYPHTNTPIPPPLGLKSQQLI